MSDKFSPFVHIIDDDPAIRDSVGFLLKTVGIQSKTYASAVEFLEHCEPSEASCLIVDIRMPGMSGLDLQSELQRRDTGCLIIFITGHGDVEIAVKAMRNGAFDFLQKPFKDQELLDSVNAALQEARERGRRAERREGHEANYKTLSPREREVMQMVASGKANKVIAYDLGVSQRTVEIHRARVMEKMAVRSLADLVRVNLLLGEPSPHGSPSE